MSRRERDQYMMLQRGYNEVLLTKRKNEINVCINHPCKQLHCEGWRQWAEGGHDTEKYILLFKGELDLCMFK